MSMDNNEAILRDIKTKVDQIHTTMFGVEGQGGMSRRVSTLEEKSQNRDVLLSDYPEIKKTVQENNKIIIKAVAVMAVVGILLQVGLKLWQH